MIEKELNENPDIIQNIIIDIELEDFKAFINNNRVIYTYEAQGTGDNCATAAVDSLAKNIPLKKISSALLYFTIHPDFPIALVGEAVEIVYKNTSSETDVFLSVIANDSLPMNEVQVSIMYAM